MIRNPSESKSVIKRYRKRKVYQRFKVNIWGVDLTKTESLSSKNRGVRDLSYVINLFTKYACVKPLNIKNVARIVFHGFTAIANETKPKLNKIWVAHGRNFTKNLCKKG